MSFKIRYRKRWRYKGVLHEFLEAMEACNFSTIEGAYYTVSGRKGDRSKNPNKYYDDAKVLEKGYKDALEEGDDMYKRYGYYCANSYFDAHMYEKAIEWYKITIEKGGWDQEKYMSCKRIHECYDILKQTDRGYHYLIKSFKFDKQRLECLYPLLVNYCCEGQNDVAYNFYRIVKDFYENKYLTLVNLNDKLFVAEVGDVYHYKSTEYHEVKPITGGIRYTGLFYIRERDLGISKII
jgi:tetratricopeptide (TPR) repeat protein